MPSRTPGELSNYRNRFPRYDAALVDTEINNIGALLTDGQYLFHGGAWKSGQQLITSAPFSTSLCPQVALRNAEHRGKAYDAGRIDLFALRVINPKTNVFVYRRRGADMGHENEVLFASGATLTLRHQTIIKSNYRVGKVVDAGRLVEKEVPASVLEIDIS